MRMPDMRIWEASACETPSSLSVWVRQTLRQVAVGLLPCHWAPFTPHPLPHRDLADRRSDLDENARYANLGSFGL